MDPNQALASMRAALADMRAAETDENIDAESAALEVADHAAYLDEWLSRGGFLPDAWIPKHLAKRTYLANHKGL